MSGYTSLNVWHRAMDLAAGVYDVARLLPKTEQLGMTSQLQRAVASVPANIAEGYQRGSRKDYARFIAIARGSLAETETFLLLAVRVGHLEQSAITSSLSLADEVSRMLTQLKRRLDAPPGRS
ncbi:four helix bundle protein [Brevundimonas sp. FT23028]|uniref:four helix bundle protein n=1 Tax=Brevundimonas sp. FT23028 TaxID=3393748 RepID=UPI003B585DC3